MDKKPIHELFCQHPDNPILSVNDWPYDANSVFNAAAAEVGLALLDVEEPTRMTHRGDEWIFDPKASYGREADVDDVVFPCGWTERDGTVHIYYGAADSCIAYATARLEDRLDYVRRFPCHE